METELYFWLLTGIDLINTFIDQYLNGDNSWPLPSSMSDVHANVHD